MNALLFKRSIFNLRMLAVTVLSFGILFLALVTSNSIPVFWKYGIKNGMDLLSSYAVAFAMSSFVIFAGVFPGTAYAYSFLEERNSGYLKFIYLRTSRKKYAVQKIFFSGLAGGVSMLLPALLIFIVLDIISLPTTPENHQQVFETLIWQPYMYIWGGRLILVFKTILMFLFGVMWGEVALLVSLCFRNKYVAYALPFLIFQVCGVLVRNDLNPMFLIRADFDLTMPIYQPFLTDLIYIVILSIINWFLFQRQARR